MYKSYQPTPNMECLA